MKIFMKSILLISFFVISNGQYCNNLVPGLNKLTRSLDVTQLDLFSLDNSLNGFKRKLIDLTCNEQKKWTNPFNNKQYDLPDQIETINTLPGSFMDAKVSVYRTLDDLKESYSKNLKVETAGQYGMFTDSVFLKDYQKILSSTQRIVEVNAHFSAFSVDLQPFWELEISKALQSFLKRMLPDDYKNNEVMFANFIKHYGTHYFSTGHIGGVFQTIAIVNDDLLKLMNIEDIKKNALATFFKLAKENAIFSGSVSQIKPEYTNKVETKLRYFGGNQNLISVGNWSGWITSVSSDPWLFGGKLESIVNIIPDEKKLAFIHAYEVHLDHSYLKYLQRSLNKNKFSITKISDFNKKLSALISNPVPDHSEVEEIGEVVEEFLFLPKWFTKETDICIKWEADGDVLQCNNGDPSKMLCSKTNSYTPFYKDITDDRPGGCKMSWGIISPNSKAWFKKVEICFQWKAEADPGQCGVGSLKETCSSIGNFTVPYLDDTNGRGGGCFLSWKLNVPDSSPRWLLNTELCYKWDVYGDAGQCWAPEKEMCAIANSWTKFYKDDTDSRFGHCLMSWELRTNDNF